MDTIDHHHLYTSHQQTNIEIHTDFEKNDHSPSLYYVSQTHNVCTQIYLFSYENQYF